jgi:hypothetical protein
MRGYKILAILAFGLIAIHSVCAEAESSDKVSHTPNPIVWIKIGQPLNFSCSSFGNPLSLCTWEFGGSSKKTITFNKSNARDGKASSVAGFSFSGAAGLDRGYCGLKIKKVKEEDFGEYECILRSTSGDYRGKVEVKTIVKPSTPIFLEEFSTSDLTDPYRLEATCGASNGQPPPTFKWLIGDDEVTDAYYNDADSVDRKGNSWTLQSLRYRGTWKDNGKSLRCVIAHEALTDGDEKEVSVPISVKFEPKVTDFDGDVLISALGSSATFAVNISANPKPEMHWEVIEDGHGDQIAESNNNDARYKPSAIKEISSDTFENKLVIGSVQEEDFKRIFALQIKNELGYGEFRFRLVRQEDGKAPEKATPTLEALYTQFKKLESHVMGKIYSLQDEVGRLHAQVMEERTDNSLAQPGE